MLKLYHGTTSVCSAKARIALEEKGLEWESVLIDMLKNEHLSAEHYKISPKGEVPVLIHDDFILRESSAIIAYLDGLSEKHKLMPEDNRMKGLTQMWLVRCIEIHAAINSISFATLFREREMATRTPEEMEAWFAKMSSPEKAMKRRDVFRNGVESGYVDGAIETFNLMLREMDAALAENAWLTGPHYGLADVALTSYVDRLERLGMEGFWKDRFPGVREWLKAVRMRPSYEAAIGKYYTPEINERTRATAGKHWPALSAKL